MGRARHDDVGMDMTPMIDVTFQLIIFFVVTFSIQKEYDKTIVLEDGIHGPEIKGEEQKNSFIIEVDRNGEISMHNVAINKQQLYSLVKARFSKYGEFPILIRGDYRTKHKDIRAVMDVCTSVGVWRVNFLATKERKKKRFE